MTETYLIDLEERELDRLVAIHIMGWTHVEYIRWKDENGVSYKTPILEGRSPDSPNRSDLVPNYSTDPKDTMSLLTYITSADPSLHVNIEMMGDVTKVNMSYLSGDVSQETLVDEGPTQAGAQGSFALAVAIASLYYFFNNIDITLEEIEDKATEEAI